MVKGNLMLETEAFRISNEELGLFAERMESFLISVEKCREHGDTIYGKGDLSYTEFLGRPLYEYCDPETYILLKDTIPGFSRDLHIFLTYELLNYDNKICTPTCKTLADLESIFSKGNNGLLGPECDRFDCATELTVFSDDSWHDWKIAYLTKYPSHINVDYSKHTYLFNIEYSNKILARISLEKFGHAEFYKGASHIPPGGPRNALALEVGRIIAKKNFYKYNDPISKLNNTKSQQRDIYSLDAGGFIKYLSIDVENVAFEVCNDRGQHLCAIKFDGTIQSYADSKGRHNIKVE
jgi:hypothetical protein